MTFILNILHRDLSILAADKQAFSVQQTDAAKPIPVAGDCRKITLNSAKDFAVGISGYTQDHFYFPEITFSSSADECIRKIRRNMESALCTDDRKSLNQLEDFMINEGIATFYDDSLAMFYTSTYLFSPIEIHTKLHRGTDKIKVLHAGTGSQYFNNDLLIDDVTQLDDVISAIKEAYNHVSQNDKFTGAEVSIFVSNRSDGKFREINQC